MPLVHPRLRHAFVCLAATSVFALSLPPATAQAQEPPPPEAEQPAGSQPQEEAPTTSEEAAPSKVQDLTARPYEASTFWSRLKRLCTALQPIPVEALDEATPKAEDQVHWKEVVRYCKDGSAPAMSKLDDEPSNVILLRLEALARLRSSREWIRPLRAARDQLCDAVDREKLLEQLHAGLPEARFAAVKEQIGPPLDKLVADCAQTSETNLGFKVLKTYRTLVSAFRKESTALKSEPAPDAKDTARSASASSPKAHWGARSRRWSRCRPHANWPALRRRRPLNRSGVSKRRAPRAAPIPLSPIACCRGSPRS